MGSLLTVVGDFPHKMSRLMFAALLLLNGNFAMGETPRQPVLVPFLLGSQQPPSEGDMRNCTADRPCQYGEGVCTEDSHCVPRLVCGADNCGAFVPGLTGSCCALLLDTVMREEESNNNNNNNNIN